MKASCVLPQLSVGSARGILMHALFRRVLLRATRGNRHGQEDRYRRAETGSRHALSAAVRRTLPAPRAHAPWRCRGADAVAADIRRSARGFGLGPKLFLKDGRTLVTTPEALARLERLRPQIQP